MKESQIGIAKVGGLIVKPEGFSDPNLTHSPMPRQRERYFGKRRGREVLQKRGERILD